MTPEDLAPRIVRCGELKPCRTAFNDAHTPGAHRKETLSRSAPPSMTGEARLFHQMATDDPTGATWRG